MAEKSSFFNSINGDRKYSAEDWAAYFSSFISNGVFAKPSDSLQVMADKGMQIKIKIGSGFINGYYYRNNSVLTKTLSIANGAFDRIDRVVLRWSLIYRNITIAVKEGTYATKATAPALTRNAEIYELALADILVGKGVTAITQSAITDKRANSSLCGYVVGVIKQFDFSTMCTQFEAFFDEYEEKIHGKYLDVESSLGAWFENVQAVLDGDVAGHLQNEIDQNKQNLSRKQDLITVSGMLKGDGNGGVRSGILGGDYGAIAFTVILPISSWSNPDDNGLSSLTVSNENFRVDGCCFQVAPDPGFIIPYSEGGIYADNVSVNGKMTFHCESVPSVDVRVNIVRFVTSAGATLTEGIQLVKGDKGDPFTYADFTAKQLSDLKGESPGISLARNAQNNGVTLTVESEGSTQTIDIYDGGAESLSADEINEILGW